MNAEPSRRETSVSESSIRERDPANAQWTWTICGPAPKLGNVRFADWDTDGHCLVATTRGLFFWDGVDWKAVSGGLDPLGVRFIRFVGLGRWLVGNGEVWLCAFGVLSLLWTHAKFAFEHFDGTLDDIALAGGRSPSGAPVLRAHVGGEWLDAFALRDLAVISSIARIDDRKWLVTGQTHASESYAALVEPLAQRMKRLQSTSVTAFVASAGLPKLGVGCAVGFGGVLLCDRVAAAVEPANHATAVAINPAGRVVVASPGRIWIRRGAPDPSWDVVWEDASARRPIVALAADASHVYALTNNAAILEGHAGAESLPRPVGPSLPDIGDEDDEVTLAG